MDFDFKPAESHNPDCDITCMTYRDEQFCYGIYIGGDKAGQEFFEWYRGPNYVPGASKRLNSYSKHYVEKDGVINTSYNKRLIFYKLKEYYKKHFFNPRFEFIFAI